LKTIALLPFTIYIALNFH